MSLAQRIFRIFLYIFMAQIGIIGLWAFLQLFYSKKAYPEKIVESLINIDKYILEGAALQNKIKSYSARDLLVYRILETNSVDSVEFVDISDKSKIITLFKLEECNKTQSATICSRANNHYLTSLIPVEFDSKIEGYLKLEKSLRGYKETNKKILISIGLTTLIIFLVNLLTIFMVWSKFLKPETQRLLKALSNQTKDDKITINEFNLIQDQFLMVLTKRQIAEAEKSKLESKMELLGLATQVAHDIRSPLEVLKGIKDDLKSLPEKTRRRVWTSIQRIEEIAYNLLKNHRNHQTNVGVIENIGILKLILNVVTEKRIEFKAFSNIEIESAIDERAYILHSKFNRDTLQRILSNLINNAVESLSQGKGKVLVKVQASNKKNIISISDDGRGIPKDIQDKLFSKGFTTKTEGNGLGLYHAKKEIENMGGSISCESIEGEGTTFYITLPDSEKSPLLPGAIDLHSYRKVIILDDDPSIHEVWNKRFEKLNFPIEHFFSFEGLLSRYPSIPSDALLLCDFELQDDRMDGVFFIDKIGHQSSSILVTARDEENEIFKRCFRVGIALLPKELINYIPIKLPFNSSSMAQQIILIDDDRLMHINWKDFCSKYNFVFQSFFTIEDFIEARTHIQKDALIYVDSNLAGGVRGEIQAKRICDIGYTNIFMCTGYEKGHFAEYPWIKGVISKAPDGIVHHIN
jgi:signal transduction histidine kinase